MQLDQQQFLTINGVSIAVVPRGGNWRGNIPYLRAIMSLTRDDVKLLSLSSRGTTFRERS